MKTSCPSSSTIRRSRPRWLQNDVAHLQPFFSFLVSDENTEEVTSE